MPQDIDLDREFDEFTKTNDDKIRKIFENYRRGFITADDLKWQVGQVFITCSLFPEEKQLRRRISESNWEDFLCDYEKWKYGKLPNSVSEKPWLISRRSGDGSDCAATPEERTVFFKVIEYIGLPTAYYEPIPAHIATPDLYFMTYGTSTKWGIGGIVDDGGLVDDPEPVGKTFVLTDRHGLKTQVAIQKMVKDLLGNSEYYSVGTIEGYTSSTSVEIRIWTLNNNVSTLNVYMRYDGTSAEHYQAHRDFPLWQDYHRESGKRDTIYYDCQRAFVDRYWEDPNL